LSIPQVVAICGKSKMAVEALDFIHYLSLSHGFDLLVVPGKGDPDLDTWQPSLRQAAGKLGVSIASLSDLKPLANLLLLSLEYDRILRTEHFASSRLYNIHLSALPAYRGCYTATWPILNGETSAGVTLHEITDGIDEGPIVDQALFPLSEHVTARSLYDHLLQEGSRLLHKNIEALLHGTARAETQNEARATYYKRSSLRLPEDANLPTSLTSEQMLRAVRAFNFPEYQVAKVLGRKVTAARVVARNCVQPEGYVIEANERYFVCVLSDRTAVQFTLGTDLTAG